MTHTDGAIGPAHVRAHNAPARITDAGRETWRRATPGHLEGVTRYFFRPLDAADIAGLQTALEKILLAESGEM